MALINERKNILTRLDDNGNPIEPILVNTYIVLFDNDGDVEKTWELIYSYQNGKKIESGPYAGCYLNSNNEPESHRMNLWYQLEGNINFIDPFNSYILNSKGTIKDAISVYSFMRAVLTDREDDIKNGRKIWDQVILDKSEFTMENLMEVAYECGKTEEECDKIFIEEMS